MATIKGQNLRVLLSDDGTTANLACVAASTNCVVHLALDVQEDTTKDTEDDWIVNEPVGINWDAQVDALVLIDDEETAITADTLVVGQVYLLRFSQTATTAGTENRNEVANEMQLTGSAILSDLQLTAQAQDVATYSAKFTGTGDLQRYTPPSPTE